MLKTTRLALACTLPALTAAGCSAAPDPMAGLYGNTWEMRAGGAVNRFHVDADGTWKGWFGEEAVTGTWQMRGKEVCFKAAEDPEEHCERDVLGKTVGSRWRTVDDGEAFDATIREGRE